MKIKIELSPNSFINKKIIEELDDLFEMSPPATLRKSLTDIFLSYLCNTEPHEYKPEIKEIASDFYFLLKFLEIAEMYEKKKPI